MPVHLPGALTPPCSLPPAASAVEPLLWATVTAVLTSVVHFSVVAPREIADGAWVRQTQGCGRRGPATHCAHAPTYGTPCAQTPSFASPSPLCGCSAGH
jgi:hypothetical protein